MSRPSNKEELIEAANTNFDKLFKLMDSMPERALNTEFDFSQDSHRKEAHWKRDKNLRDVLIHLYEWHQLLLKWVNSNMAGTKSDFLPEPYTWKTYGEMNIEIWQKHQSTLLEESIKMVKSSHGSVVDLATSFSNEELFTKKHFDWTGSTSLASYCISSLSSHYDWAIKKLKAHLKNFHDDRKKMP